MSLLIALPGGTASARRAANAVTKSSSLAARAERYAGQQLVGGAFAGRDLQGENFANANLRGANFVGANLKGATFANACLDGADFGAADLEGAILNGVTASSTNFGQANLTRANALGADFGAAVFSHAILNDANFVGSKFEKARLHHATCVGADFHTSDFSGADFTEADLTGTSFEQATIEGTVFKCIRQFDGCVFFGCDLAIADCTSSSIFKRHCNDENYIRELREHGPWNAFGVWLWWASSDCGRSFSRWAFWSALIAVFYGAVFTVVGVDFGANETWLSPYYFSVVTLTSLGYGDVLPTTLVAQLVAMSESLAGFCLIGGLISIFSNKVARRAD